MGCWNQTCGLTQLHIRAGDEVMVFAIVKALKVTDLCYTTPFYSPIMMPFYAKYDDYGGGEECSGLGLKIVMDAIKQRLVDIPQGPNQYHDIPVKKESFDVDVFFEACHERRLFVEHYTKTRQHVDFVMFRKDVIDYLMENRVLEQYVGNGQGTSGWGNNYVKYKFADVVKGLPECVDQLMSVKDSPLGLWEPLRQLRELKSANHAASWLENSDNYRYSNLMHVNEHITHLITRKANDKLVEYLTEYLKAQFIDGFMSSTRKHWIPQTGAGSQQQEHGPYRLLMSAMGHALDKEKAEWESENIGEFEEA
jgi:hypothetical protein